MPSARTFECLGDVEGPRWLDGVTGDATVQLTRNNNLSGTFWKVKKVEQFCHANSQELVRARCQAKAGAVPAAARQADTGEPGRAGRPLDGVERAKEGGTALSLAEVAAHLGFSDQS